MKIPLSLSLLFCIFISPFSPLVPSDSHSFLASYSDDESCVDDSSVSASVETGDDDLERIFDSTLVQDFHSFSQTIHAVWLTIHHCLDGARANALLAAFFGFLDTGSKAQMHEWVHRFVYEYLPEHCSGEGVFYRINHLTMLLHWWLLHEAAGNVSFAVCSFEHLFMPALSFYEKEMIHLHELLSCARRGKKHAFCHHLVLQQRFFEELFAQCLIVGLEYGYSFFEGRVDSLFAHLSYFPPDFVTSRLKPLIPPELFAECERRWNENERCIGECLI